MIALRIPKGDLALVDRQFVTISGAEYARQGIEVSGEFFLGEWFLDKRQGMPYFRDVFVKNPNADTVRSVFRRMIMKWPGIVAVPRLEYTLDPTTRRGTIDFLAVYKDGQPIPSRLEFIY